MSHVAKWQRTYSDDFRIAINVSPRQFRDPNLVSHIQTCLQKSNLSNTSLELEITEGVLLNNHSLVNAALEDLNKMGVRLAMDDFGTGYSSMSYLRFYPFDTLKIDRSFIRDVLSDKADRALVCAMIDLGHSLGLKVVAEGVETAEQGQFLREKSCDYMQGYYYSRPLCSDDFDKFLEKM